MPGAKHADTTEFAGLTTHNNIELSDGASQVSGFSDDEMPETSLATVVRELRQAKSEGLAWTLPERVAPHINVEEVENSLTDAATVVRADEDTVFVQTERFQSIVDPEQISQMFAIDDDDTIADPLWHVPTNNYEIINPQTAYEPLLETIGDEESGNAIFGEVKEYRNGGEVYIDILFDAHQIDYSDGDPLVLGVRTGYDFFGSTSLFFEGFAQDTRCDNSIRSITDREVVKHFGENNIEETIEDVLSEIGAMRDHLAELIELAEGIELDLMENDFAEAFEAHDDDLRAWYELCGFPSYLAQAAASHARNRADDQFSPDYTALWDGATYALTHNFRGGEDSATLQGYVQTANDMVMNPSAVMDTVTQEHEHRLSEIRDDDDDGDELPDATATIQQSAQSIEAKKERFVSRTERLRETLIEQ